MKAMPERRWRALGRPLLWTAAFAAFATPAAAQSPSPAAPSAMPIVMALAAVLTLIPVAIWLLKRLGGGATAQASGLQVVGQMPLGAGQRVVVLQAGNRWLLLGVTGSSITRLGSLPKPPVDPNAVAAQAISPSSFAALLARAGRGDRPTT